MINDDRKIIIDNRSTVEESKRSPSLQLNRISFKMPNVPPVTQPELIHPEQFCNYSTIAMEKCKTEQCVCTQTFHAKLNSVVELVLIDPGEHFFFKHTPTKII